MLVRAIKDREALPPDDRVSAVFLLALQGNDILAVRNERGWDIPGGHVEPGEAPAAALRREVLEEAAAAFGSAEPCAMVETEGRPDVMLCFATAEFELLSFSPTEDALERDVIPVQLLLDRYHGPKHILQQLIDSASPLSQRRR